MRTEEGGAEPVCGFCGTPLADGSHGWVLSGIHAANSGDGHALLQEVRDVRESRPGPMVGAVATPAAPARTEALEWVAHAAIEDGRIDDEESEVLRGMAARLGVPREKLHEIVADATGERQALVEPRNTAEAKQWMEALTSVMLEDGRVSSAEKQLLESAGARCGYVAADVAMLIRRQKTALHRETRAARREV